LFNSLNSILFINLELRNAAQSAFSGLFPKEAFRNSRLINIF